MFRPMMAAAAFIAAGACCAQQAPADASKQALAQRVLQLWHVETLGRTMLQEPVADALQQARVMLQGRAPADRRDAAMHDIAEEAKKFLDENGPLVDRSAQRLAAPTLAPLLAERFTEEELRQIVTILESPARRKFEAAIPELQKALGEKLAADTGPVIDSRLKALRERIGLRLRSAVTP